MMMRHHHFEKIEKVETELVIHNGDRSRSRTVVVEC